MRKYLILLFFSLSGCYQELDMQINPYICIDDYKWDIEGNEIADEYGNQLTCKNSNRT